MEISFEYLGNIVIFSSIEEEHILHVRFVLSHSKKLE